MNKRNISDEKIISLFVLSSIIMFFIPAIVFIFFETMTKKILRICIVLSFLILIYGYIINSKNIKIRNTMILLGACLVIGLIIYGVTSQIFGDFLNETIFE